MDRKFFIGIVKYIINYFSITTDELGFKQNYRPVAFGSELNVTLQGTSPNVNHYLGVLERKVVLKTPTKTRLEPVNHIMIVDSSEILSTKSYHICVAQ